ncbi:PCNA-interacting partner isoform X6 [Dermochelys coriacea]|uniref:PCNA-interacting partner isoform X6 n=1 Tax=Dermochelys coriacea TaxID=27794 RepID=UPI001CA9CC20|nr:PCNA-interacting partner isoform X6 [Dermochelys coriacea]
MATFQQKILNMLKCFRRQWCLFADSERTTVCGADCMMMALQLSMAEVNKQLHGDFTVSLSDVVETWKYLLHDKLGLTCENMEAPENYADIKKTYDTFLKRSNMLDLIDICRKCHTLTSESEIEEMSPVKLLKFISGLSEENGSSLSIPSTPIRHSQDNVKPRLHAINHGTAYCGRETVKALLALLDEEAANLPTKNKAELLYGDENVTPFGITSVLTLFRSPAQSTRSSPKPLRQRIKTSVGERKIKMKQPLIRSQFACTYKDDVMTEKKDQHFFSRSQIPTCIHPAPKRILALCLEAETFAEGVKSPPERPALGTSSGNVHRNGSKSEKAKSCQPRNKNSKRKHMDLNSEQVICSNENEPLQYTNIKRPKISNILQKKLDSKLDGAAKSNKAMAKNKLIAGQKKLTDFFFRL